MSSFIIVEEKMCSLSDPIDDSWEIVNDEDDFIFVNEEDFSSHIDKINEENNLIDFASITLKNLTEFNFEDPTLMKACNIEIIDYDNLSLHEMRSLLKKTRCTINILDKREVELLKNFREKFR